MASGFETWRPFESVTRAGPNAGSGAVGQVTTAAMAAQLASPVMVWLGAVSALVTKGALAACVGAGVRQWIQTRVPVRAVRFGSVILLIVLGALTAFETLATGHW